MNSINEEDEEVTQDLEESPFDRFMDSILIKENKEKKVDGDETPQRIYNKKFREYPQNRIKFGVK